MNNDFLMIIGILSNCMWGDSFSRRNMARETYMTYSNRDKIDFRFVVGTFQSDLNYLPSSLQQKILTEMATHKDIIQLNVPERKSPILKTLGWYRYAISIHPKIPFVAKLDDDAYVHPIKLEYNLKPMVGNNLVYLGATLWGSYITDTFQACGRRMGPVMTYYAMKDEKCIEKGAIGPFPYVVGMMQILSSFLVKWIVDQPFTHSFENRTFYATKPPMMDHGEDMVIGMLIHLSPYPITAMHWGWDKFHDLCFECKQKDQLWRPITENTIVTHHVASWNIIYDVHKKIQLLCDQNCQQKKLSFEIANIDELCSKPKIASVYEWCAYNMSE